MGNTQTASIKATSSVKQCELAGKQITIRPITKQDMALEADFIRQLSAETKHYRFFGGVNSASEAMLESLCDVDGENAMAFVATLEEMGREVEIGVSRYAIGDETDVHEIALTVADRWQHQGLGKLLMMHLIDYAKAHGVKAIFSVELADNNSMRLLAKDLGMTAKVDPQDIHQMIYSLTL